MKLAEDLRRAVLQAAIEGKLTGGSREGWHFVRLGDVVRVISGTSYEKHEVCRKGVRIIRGGNLVGEKIVLKDDDVFLPNEYTNKEKQVQQNDIVIIASTGSLKGICRAAFADINFDEPIQIGAFLRIIRPIDSSLADYLKVIFAGQYYRSHISSVVNGIGIKNIREKHITELIIPLPPIEEQQRIVSRLDAILPLIAELELAENELEILERKFPGDMRDSLLQAAIQGKLTRSNMDNWQRVRLRDISLSVQYGYNAPAREEGTVKMIRITDIQNNNVQWDNVPYCEISEDEMQKYLLAKNDILFARTGGTVGKSYLVDDMPEKAIYAGYLIRMRLKDEVNPQYVKYFMESESYWKQLRNGTTATAQPNCNGKTLSRMIIPLPPIEEQRKIVSRLNELLPLCEAMKGE